MNKITDRELLAICNLSNLRMEFANIIDKETEIDDIDNTGKKKKIVSNHTIYSLLEKECNGLKIREEWEKQWREENLLKIELNGSKRDHEREKYKEKLEEERRNRFGSEDEEYGSFYSVGDDKRKTYEYFKKEDLQKAAPIIMEYFDRYNLSSDKENHEGKFLEEWEIIYGADFYKILLDYAFKTHQEYSKDSEKCKDVDDYIKKKKIPSRKNLLNKEEKIEFLNIIWDFATALIGGPSAIVGDAKMTIESGEGTGLIKNVYELFAQNELSENIDEEHKNNIEAFKKKQAFKFKGVIKFKVIDFRIIILRKKETSKYIVAFYNSKDNMIVESIENGAVNLDLVLVNEIIEYEIRKISKNENIEIIYTGYGYASLMAFSSHAMFKTLFNQNLDSAKIKTFSKVFVGEKKRLLDKMDLLESNKNLDFEKIITFDIKKLAYIHPGSVTYSENIADSLKNVISMSLVNIAGTKGVSLAAIFLTAGSSAFIPTIIGSLSPVVFIGVFIGYFARSEKYRFKIKNIKKRMIKQKILINKGDYIIINKEFHEYSSVFGINKRIEEKISTKRLAYKNNKKKVDNKSASIKKEEETVLKKDLKLYPITLDTFGEKNKIIINVPKEVAIALCFVDYYKRISPHLEANTIEFFKEDSKYRLKLDSQNNFLAIEEVWEGKQQGQVYKILKNPKFELENLFEYVLSLMTIIQNKYDFENKIFENSEFIYMKQLELTEEEKEILELSLGHDENEKDENGKDKKSRYSFEEEALLKDKYNYELSIDNSLNNEQTAEVENLNKEIYDGEGGFNAERRQYEKFVPRYDKIPYYTELTKIDQYEVVSVDHNDNLEYRENTNVEESNNFKLNKVKVTPYIKIDNFEKKKFIYAKRIPALTKKLDEIEYINYTKNSWLENKIPYSEYIYFPYVENDGKITEDVREDYIGSLFRSSFRRELKYNSLDEEQGDILVYNSPLNGEEGNKNEKLNKYFIQKLKRYGQELGYPEHYNSVMKLLEANPKLIENYYTLQELNKSISTKNLKIGILNGEEYALDKIGFIYNADNIYGRAIDFNYNYDSGNKLKEISTYGVCQGAKLWCSEGDAAGTLLVTSQDFEYTDGNLDVTLGDNKAFTNITPFGRCSCNKKKSCSKYISLGEWSKMSTGTEINNKKSILSTSTITCQEGGTIIILDPKNKTFNN